MLQFLDQVPNIRALLDILTVVAVAVVTVRGSRIVEVIRNYQHFATLLGVRDKRIGELTQERDDLRKSVDAAITAGSGWQVLAEQWKSSVDLLTDRVETMESSLRDLKKRFSVGTRYIADLLLYIESEQPHTPPPPVPIEIQDDIDNLEVA